MSSKHKHIEMGYYNTYYYANMIDNLLSNRFTYIRTISEVFEDEGHLWFVEPFSKYSALHKFTAICVRLVFEEDLSSDYVKRMIKNNTPSLPINRAFEYYDIDYTTFEQWYKYSSSYHKEDCIEDQLDNYYNEISIEQPFEDLMNRLCNEVFYIVFSNRNILLLLNDLVADYISSTNITDLEDEYKKLFSKNGVLKRRTIPVWVKRAVFFRDRGICIACNKDLTGLMNINNAKHYDHIVPLALGGLNDITNIQLLCEKCNLKKSSNDIYTSSKYEHWY